MTHIHIFRLRSLRSQWVFSRQISHIRNLPPNSIKVWCLQLSFVIFIGFYFWIFFSSFFLLFWILFLFLIFCNEQSNSPKYKPKSKLNTTNGLLHNSSLKPLLPLRSIQMEHNQMNDRSNFFSTLFSFFISSDAFLRSRYAISKLYKTHLNIQNCSNQKTFICIFKDSCNWPSSCIEGTSCWAGGCPKPNPHQRPHSCEWQQR